MEDKIIKKNPDCGSVNPLTRLAQLCSKTEAILVCTVLFTIKGIWPINTTWLHHRPNQDETICFPPDEREKEKEKKKNSFPLFSTPQHFLLSPGSFPLISCFISLQKKCPGSDFVSSAFSLEKVYHGRQEISYRNLKQKLKREFNTVDLCQN